MKEGASVFDFEIEVLYRLTGLVEPCPEFDRLFKYLFVDACKMSMVYL